MNVITTATWRALGLYNGVPQEFIKHHKTQGYSAIFPKIGDGLTQWVGLINHFIAAKNAGLSCWAWWYCRGIKGEGLRIGQHADTLGVDVIVLDIETIWENAAGWTQAAREKSAYELIDGIRAGGFTGKIALCSWWNTALHYKTPFKILLSECDYNMPQMYWIGRHSEAQAAALVEDSLNYYEDLGFPANKTFPVLASFGQEYGKYNTWWKTTIPQMRAAFETASARGCAGASFYSTDYLLGGAGHEYPAKVETEFLKLISSMTPEPAPPAVQKIKIIVQGDPSKYDIILEEA